jgi:molybdopterin/thiamine biosynthesis adenylyltransferase
MTAQAIESTYRVVLGDADVFRIMLVGVGGTGSALALFLAGLAYHARHRGVQVELTLVDPDHIDPVNVGRQAFAPAEALGGDLSKAASLALRLNCRLWPGHRCPARALSRPRWAPAGFTRVVEGLLANT